jgi:hypothetical protein
MGIALLISLFRSRTYTEYDDMGEVVEAHGRAMWNSVLHSVITFGIGYIYHLFM